MTTVAAHRTRRRLGRVAAGWAGVRTPVRRSTWRPNLRPLASVCERRPRSTVVVLAAFTSGVGLVVGGPVAAGIAALYAALAASGLMRRRRERVTEVDRMTGLDAVAGLAAELRAGTPAQPALRAGLAALQRNPVAAAAVCAAWQVSDRTGAGLADVLDRVEAHLRSQNRIRQTAIAHTAGARATALLLAALPLGGIALGYFIGVDPLHLLLRTAAGAACCGLAAALQVAGLAWASRLSKVDVP